MALLLFFLLTFSSLRLGSGFFSLDNAEVIKKQCKPHRYTWKGKKNAQIIEREIRNYSSVKRGEKGRAKEDGPAPFGEKKRTARVVETRTA